MALPSLRRALLAAALLFALTLLAGCAPPVAPLPPAPEPTPDQVRSISLPQDDGPHQMLTEWWYYTGHLQGADGSRYGFEYVIFQALRGQNPPYYVGHFAVTDHQRKAFQFDQRSAASDEAPAGPGFNLGV